MLKYLLCLVFIVRVTIPTGTKVTYEAKRVEAGTAGYYYLTLLDGRVVYVPVMFTVIEEK